MADELKIVVDAEVELDQRQAEQEINSKAKKLNLDQVKIGGELDKEATRRNLNAAIRGIDGLPTVKIKAEFEAAVSNKSINKAADQIRKSLSKLSVPVNIEVGKMATVSPSKSEIKAINNEVNKAMKNFKSVNFKASDTGTISKQLLGMGLDQSDVNDVVKMIEEGGYQIENVMIKTGQRVMKAYKSVTKMVKGKEVEAQEPYYYATNKQHLQSLSVGGTTKDGLSVVKQVNWDRQVNNYKASTTYGASLSETGQIVKDTKSASEKYRQQIEKLKRDVSSIESRALKQVNSLEGGFAQQMKDEIAKVRDALEGTEKIDIEKAKTEVSKLKDIFNELNALQNTQNDLAHKSVSRKVAETTPKMQTVKQIYDSYMSKLQSAGLDTSGLAEAHGNMTSAFADAGAANATSAEWEKFTLASKGYAEALKQAKFALKEFNEEAVNSNKVSKTITDFEKMTTKFNGLSQKLNLAGMGSDLSEVTAAYNKMSQAMTTAQEQNTSQAWGEYAKAHEEYARAVNKSSQALSEHNKMQREQQQAAKVAQKAQQDLLRLQKMQSEWSAAFRDPHFAKQATQIKGMLTSGDVERMRQGSQAFRTLSLEIQAAGKAVKTFGDKFKEMFSKFTGWFSVSQLVRRSIQGINNMQTTVEEVDASMEDLEKVTTSTRAGYDEFLDEAKDKANELRTSITSVIDATSGWSRLGYSLKDSAVLGEWSTIYKNVGDNVESAEAATKHLVSITKAFGTEGKSMVGMVESVVDRLNAVGNKTSISSGEIGTALQNSASALQNAGNTLSESIALTVGAYDITQDASETGNMWKTVSCDLFLIEKIRRYMLWRTNGLTSGMIG